MADQSSPPIHWLPQTKLQRPRLRDDVILRQRLLDSMHEVVAAHRLTLISAPAGYGKTTLATSVAHTTTLLKTSWLALDEDDNNPISFLVAFVAALQRLNPDCGLAAQSLFGNQAAGLPVIVAVTATDVFVSSS